MNMSNESNNYNGDVMALFNNDDVMVVFTVFFSIILPLLALQLGRTHMLASILISIIIGISHARFTIKTNTSNKILDSIMMLYCIIYIISTGSYKILDILSFIIPLIIGLAGTYITDYIKNNAVNANINKNDNTYFTI